MSLLRVAHLSNRHRFELSVNTLIHLSRGATMLDMSECQNILIKLYFQWNRTCS
jgi:hypothetical protein